MTMRALLGLFAVALFVSCSDGRDDIQIDAAPQEAGSADVGDDYAPNVSISTSDPQSLSTNSLDIAGSASDTIGLDLLGGNTVGERLCHCDERIIVGQEIAVKGVHPAPQTSRSQSARTVPCASA